MSSFQSYLAQISTFIFDIDGVLTDASVQVTTDGDQLRSMSVRDGFAMRFALEQGFRICIISGANSESVRHRFSAIGIEDVFLGAAKNKLEVFDKYIKDKQLSAEEIIYMGDDIPDYYVMKKVKVATCPANAVPEILAISHYISAKNGGDGCVRDIIEQVLKAQNKWFVP